MKATGIVRKVDELGRIVLPIELRRTMHIYVRDTMQISVEGDCIILRKHRPACILCESEQDVIPYRDKMLCRNCIADIYAL